MSRPSPPPNCRRGPPIPGRFGHPFWHHHRQRHHRWHRRRMSLFWRVFRHGILLIVLATLGVATVSWFNRDVPWWDQLPKAMAHWIGQEYQASGGDTSVMERQLTALHAFHQLNITVYNAEGRVLASNVNPPLPPLDEPGLAALDRPRIPRSPGAWREVISAPMDAGGQRLGYLRFAFPEEHTALWRPIFTVLIILLAIAVGSWPLARHLTAPVASLTRTIQTFGSGDLSARVRSRRQDEVGDLARAFDAMADELQGLILSQKELLANVSHELRTPLARIRVAVELAEDEGGSPYLGEITQDLTELERMLEDVLTTARLDLAEGRAGSGDPPLRLGPINPTHLAEEAASRFRGRWPSRALELDLQPSPPSLSGDAVLLRRVLDNLLENAHKYSDEASPITLRLTHRPDGITFEVSDRGEGISPEDLAQLFEPFFRADRSRNRGTGGVGLGLALSRRIVNAHGGQIEAESELGQGATLRFTLPA